MPLLDHDSKYTIFQKILDGEMDWHLLRLVIMYSDDLTSQIEAAVVEGALPWEACKKGLLKVSAVHRASR